MLVTARKKYTRYKQIGYYTKRCMSYQRARLRTEVKNNEKDIANKQITITLYDIIYYNNVDVYRA